MVAGATSPSLPSCVPDDGGTLQGRSRRLLLRGFALLSLVYVTLGIAEALEEPQGPQGAARGAPIAAAFALVEKALGGGPQADEAPPARAATSSSNSSSSSSSSSTSGASEAPYDRFASAAPPLSFRDPLTLMPAKSSSLFSKLAACADTDPRCQYELSLFYLLGRPPLWGRCLLSALQLLWLAARGGSAEAQYLLGVLHQNLYLLPHEPPLAGTKKGLAGGSDAGAYAGVDRSPFEAKQEVQEQQAAPQTAAQAMDVLLSAPDFALNPPLPLVYIHAAAIAQHPAAAAAAAWRQQLAAFEGSVGQQQQACAAAANHYLPVAKATAGVYASGIPQAVEVLRLSGGLGLSEEDEFYRLSGDPEHLTMLIHEANEGNLTVHALLGRKFLFGVDGFPQDFAKARYHLLAASRSSKGEAKSLLGYMYALGLGVEADLNEAAEWFFRGARENQDPIAFNGVHKSFVEALRWLTKAVRGGSTGAAYALGVMHLSGLGAVRDCPLAVGLLKLATERASYFAHTLQRAHTAYERSAYDEAAFNYLLLAEAGHEAAQFNLAFLLDTGLTDIFFDDAAARAAAAKAAAAAPANVAVIAAAGTLRRKRLHAQRFYEMAAAQGSLAAQLRLGDFAYYGYGVRRRSELMKYPKDFVDENGDSFEGWLFKKKSWLEEGERDFAEAAGIEAFYRKVADSAAWGPALAAKDLFLALNHFNRSLEADEHAPTAPVYAGLAAVYLMDLFERVGPAELLKALLGEPRVALLLINFAIAVMLLLLRALLQARSTEDARFRYLRREGIGPARALRSPYAVGPVAAAAARHRQLQQLRQQQQRRQQQQQQQQPQREAVQQDQRHLKKAEPQQQSVSQKQPQQPEQLQQEQQQQQQQQQQQEQQQQQQQHQQQEKEGKSNRLHQGGGLQHHQKDAHHQHQQQQLQQQHEQQQQQQQQQQQLDDVAQQQAEDLLPPRQGALQHQQQEPQEKPLGKSSGAAEAPRGGPPGAPEEVAGAPTSLRPTLSAGSSNTSTNTTSGGSSGSSSGSSSSPVVLDAFALKPRGEDLSVGESSSSSSDSKGSNSSSSSDNTNKSSSSNSSSSSNNSSSSGSNSISSIQPSRAEEHNSLLADPMPAAAPERQCLQRDQVNHQAS
ncbi:hypothetical protein ACSSS7_005276 [Eimeria intestinalis]